jgi:hypothetical protein
MDVLLAVPLVVSEADHVASVGGFSPSVSQRYAAIQALFLPIWMPAEEGKP